MSYEAINGSVGREKIVIVQVLNKNQLHYQEEVLTQAK